MCFTVAVAIYPLFQLVSEALRPPSLLLAAALPLELLHFPWLAGLAAQLAAPDSRNTMRSCASRDNQSSKDGVRTKVPSEVYLTKKLDDNDQNGTQSTMTRTMVTEIS